MKRPIAMLAAALVLSTAASAQNPLLQRRYGTPYEIPPFEKITIDNYREAMLKGLEEEKAEVLAIIANPEAPTFENVIVALDKAGETLSRTRSVWSTLNSSNSNDEFQSLAKELNPKSSELSNFINMNKELFEKVKYVYDHQSQYNLDKEQTALLEKTYKSFVNGGALLDEDQKKELAGINLRLSELQIQFSQNLMHDNYRPEGAVAVEGGMMSQDIFVEVGHGPTLIDNNILLSDYMFCCYR